MIETSNFPQLEVCLSPALLPFISLPKPQLVVVTDILRATSAMCAAFQYGVKQIIPVSSLDEARDYKKKGFLVAAERDGKILDFADYGNSPSDYQTSDIHGKSLVYSTTNGTQAINLVADSQVVCLGSFLNLEAIAEFCLSTASENLNILILCSGWKNQISLEDSLFAGCLSKRLLDSGKMFSSCDAVDICLDLWKAAEKDLPGYVDQAAHKKRLVDLGVGESVADCLVLNTSKVVPCLRNGILEDASLLA